MVFLRKMVAAAAAVSTSATLLLASSSSAAAAPAALTERDIASNLGATSLMLASTNDTATYYDITETLLAFEAAGLSPDVISEDWLELAGALDVWYGNQSVPLGANLSTNATSTMPVFSVNITEAVEDARMFYSKMYTILIVDAGVYGSNSSASSTGNVTRHYLANNCSVSFTAQGFNVFQNTTAPVTSYAGPNPPQGDGPHRYLQLVFTQPPNFQAPLDLLNANTPVGSMNLAQYIKEANLSKIVAANYFLVQNGTVSPTATVKAIPTVPSAKVEAAVASVSSEIVQQAVTYSKDESTSGSSAGSSSASAASFAFAPISLAAALAVAAGAAVLL